MEDTGWWVPRTAGVSGPRVKVETTTASSPSFSDVALVVATARGHRDALAEAYRRHGAQVYGLARRVCGDDLAKEVVQQVFLEMWEKPNRYNPDRGSLRSFLLTQAYGRSIDRLRSDGARRAREAASVLVRDDGSRWRRDHGSDPFGRQ